MEHTILLFFSFFIEAVILWQYTSSLFIPGFSVRTRLMVLSVFYTILFLLSLFEQTGLNITCFFIVNAVFLYTQFKPGLLMALFHSAMFTTIMVISELAVFGILSRFHSDFFMNIGIGFIFYVVFSKLFFFAIIYFLVYLFKGKNVAREQYSYSELFLMLIPVSSIYIMFTFFAIGKTSSFVPPVNYMVTACAVFLLFINLLIFGINQYDQKKSRDFTDMQLLLQKESDSVEYYEMLLSQNENQSILIHDIKKHLQSIKLLNEKNASDNRYDYA